MIATQAASKYVHPCWLTMRQANELGGHVRKAEESEIIVFWKVEDRRGQAQDESDAESDEQCRRRFVLLESGTSSSASYQKTRSKSFRELTRTSTIRSKPSSESMLK
jgi:hypothetical protein